MPAWEGTLSEQEIWTAIAAIVSLRHADGDAASEPKRPLGPSVLMEIYCGRKDVRLTDEHIAPFALVPRRRQLDLATIRKSEQAPVTLADG
jgi:hypothetical protein